MGVAFKQLYDSSFPLVLCYSLLQQSSLYRIVPTKDTPDSSYGGAVVNQPPSNNGPTSLMAQINNYLISCHFDLTAVANERQYIFCGANDIFDAPLSNETLRGQW